MLAKGEHYGVFVGINSKEEKRFKLWQQTCFKNSGNHDANMFGSDKM
jgi:hypothetical protein